MEAGGGGAAAEIKFDFSVDSLVVDWIAGFDCAKGEAGDNFKRELLFGLKNEAFDKGELDVGGVAKEKLEPKIGF